MKITLTLLAVTLLSNLLMAQTTLIPDANFEQRLMMLGYDTTADGNVPTASIDTITTLNISGSYISDLTGIEAFIALTDLNCSQNQLTSLDVTQNTALTILNAGDNTQMTSLNVSQNTALTILNCKVTQISNLDVSQSTVLTGLNCSHSSLSSLDVSQNAALTDLNCSNNYLSSLDVSQNTILSYLSCYNNLPITCLNLKNGNNNNLILQTYNSPNLICIEVDDVVWSTNNWTNIDAGVSFSLNCNNICSSVSTSFETQPFSNLSFYPNPTTGIINIDLGEVKSGLIVTLINGVGKKIQRIEIGTSDQFTVNVQSPNGFYYLKIESSSGDASIMKIVKQ